MSCTASDAPRQRLIESWFPYLEVSHLVAADRRTRDPVYGVHKWFARRPPTLVRALLLASHLDDDIDEAEFWRRHGSQGPWLADADVYDPFMGGGTSLVESARMGAAVFGRDVDPIAVAVVASELRGPHPDFEESADALVSALEDSFGSLFAGRDPKWTPLHWFWLLKPTCPECGVPGLLYKDLVIARSVGKAGSVVRDDEIHAFCPLCLKVHAFRRERREVRCCGRRFKLDHGTYVRGRYVCKGCGTRSTHEEMHSAQAERVLIAIEETRPGVHRRIRKATQLDHRRAELAADASAAAQDGFDIPLETDRRDRRPVSAGYSTSKTLFTPRQWALLTNAFSRIRTMGVGGELEQDLTLMLTGILPSNNMLCGYARDWGRLAPLFSVRGFALPSLIVELNPFNTVGGRGTFKSARIRMLERTDMTVRRSTIVDGRPKRVSLDLPVSARSVDVIQRSADDDSGQTDCLASVCVTDPPYFDYIAYSELSEFFRTWLRDSSLAGAPLLPDLDSPVESFAAGLGRALKITLTRLAPDTPLIFTYHSSNADAWRAIGNAFDIAGLSVAGLWPVLADPHMGHHVAEGNCEWDVVVIARPTSQLTKVPADELSEASRVWVQEIEGAGFNIGSGDQDSFDHAWTMAKWRFGRQPTN